MQKITPQQQLELVLRAFDKVSDLVFATQYDKGTLVMANAAACRRTGYTKEELLCMHISDIEISFSLRTPEEWKKGVDRIRYSGGQHRTEGLHRCKDGSTYPVAAVISSENIDGELFFISVSQDLSERVHADAQILEAQNWLERAHAFARMGHWHIDLTTEKISWSKEVFLSFGMDPAALAPPSIEAYMLMIHPDDRGALQYSLDKVLTQTTKNRPRSGEVEVRQRQPDGTYRWFLIRAEGVVDEKLGHVRHIYGINFDIHQRKIAEQAVKNQELRRLAEQEEALEKERALNEILTKLNADLDSFVYSVSHDLRSPIASMMGLAKLAKYAKGPEDLNQVLAMQERSLAKMDSFVKDILDYSRNTKAEVVPTPIDWVSFIPEVLEQHAVNAQENGIALVHEVHGEANFYSDKFRINVVLSNLISNGIRYFDKYKEQPFVRVHVEVGQYTTQIKVQDNGVGIPPEHQQRVFEMFYRANDRVQGSGIGLYLVKETMTKLNGNIALNSVYQEGTEVSLFLPNLGVSS